LPDICFARGLSLVLPPNSMRPSPFGAPFVPSVSSAKYLPPIRLSVFKKISRNLLSPIGLYFKLNLSNLNMRSPRGVLIEVREHTCETNPDEHAYRECRWTSHKLSDSRIQKLV